MKQLRVVLSSAECEPYISWLPSGNSFCVNHKGQFVKVVLRKYFGFTNVKTFIVTLLNNGFERVDINDFVGEAVYCHEMFQLGKPELCALMSRRYVDPKHASDILRADGGRPSSASSAGGIVAEGPAAPLAAAAAAEFSVRQAAMNQATWNQNPIGGTFPMCVAGIMPSINSSSMMMPRVNTDATVVDTMMMPRGNSTAFTEAMMMPRMSSTNTMLQGQMMNSPSFSNASNFDFSYLQGLARPCAAASQINQPQLLQRPMNSLEQALAAHRQNDQVNMNSVLGMLQRANSGECTQISVFNVPYQSEPNNHPQEETAEDLQMAMLKIDSELLKVKQLKLKAMQDKLKMQLEMKRKMEN